ncbi:hypothetical protein J4H86_22595 [Spiractinospora alimapuensis]|uniref:hypothetical protein n=1 Tax=Spiractinospora alimapuensis TaxID=2820884 RepID=UPI001F46D64D|nr:hypothetical protein [Spiractinospora alimapuensis]QVQ51548.1 hypothetical protein J4H86_22595 [Spiractinospora alimapuensis]
MTEQQKKIAYVLGTVVVLGTLGVAFTLSSMTVQNMLIIAVSVLTVGFFVLRPHFTSQTNQGDQHDAKDTKVAAVG